MACCLTWCACSCAETQKRDAGAILRQIITRLAIEEHIDFYEKDDVQTSFFCGALYGRTELPAQFSSFSDYGAACSKTIDGIEIHLYIVRHRSQREGALRLVRSRMQVMMGADVQKMLGGKYETYIARMRAFEHGNYIFLLATEDNDKVIEIIRSIL